LDTHLLPHGSAIVNTIQQLAGAAGIALSFSLVSATSAVYREQGHSAATSMAQGTQWVYLAGSGLLLTALIIALFLPKQMALTSKAVASH
jgi:DHA2 family lincomycin resistance protein-like MFS transporter